MIMAMIEMVGPNASVPVPELLDRLIRVIYGLIYRFYCRRFRRARRQYGYDDGIKRTTPSQGDPRHSPHPRDL